MSEKRAARLPLKTCAKEAFLAAVPIMLGYAAIGVPCGILCDSIGLGVLQVLLMCLFFYSGAGQFMIPNMWLAGAPIASIVTSVSLVNTRQMLYSASLAPWCSQASKRLSLVFAATVTDESYGVSMAQFKEGDWSVRHALFVNLFSQSSWTVFNLVGVLVGSLLDIPVGIAAFAMTSIFICLLFTQPLTLLNVVAAIVAIVGVFVCKLVGLEGAAILIGAVAGVIAALVVDGVASRGSQAPTRIEGTEQVCTDEKDQLAQKEKSQASLKEHEGRL